MQTSHISINSCAGYQIVDRAKREIIYNITPGYPALLPDTVVRFPLTNTLKYGAGWPGPPIGLTGPNIQTAYKFGPGLIGADPWCVFTWYIPNNVDTSKPVKFFALFSTDTIDPPPGALNYRIRTFYHATRTLTVPRGANVNLTLPSNIPYDIAITAWNAGEENEPCATDLVTFIPGDVGLQTGDRLYIAIKRVAFSEPLADDMANNLDLHELFVEVHMNGIGDAF
jgi:hypothetical protein